MQQFKCSLYFVVAVSSLNASFCVCTEEERRVRANDREYNEKFQYAVRDSPNIWTLPFRMKQHFNLCILRVRVIHLIFPPSLPRVTAL